MFKAYDYATGELIGEASPILARLSDQAVLRDGGVGAVRASVRETPSGVKVVVPGDDITVWVDESSS